MNMLVNGFPVQVKYLTSFHFGARVAALGSLADFSLQQTNVRAGARTHTHTHTQELEEKKSEKTYYAISFTVTQSK